MNKMATETTWPCPFCDPGTDHFERMTASAQTIEFQCAGCGYKHREPAAQRPAQPVSTLEVEYEDVGGYHVVSGVWLWHPIAELQGPPEEIGTGLYRLVDGQTVGNEPESPEF